MELIHGFLHADSDGDAEAAPGRETGLRRMIITDSWSTRCSAGRQRDAPALGRNSKLRAEWEAEHAPVLGVLLQGATCNDRLQTISEGGALVAHEMPKYAEQMPALKRAKGEENGVRLMAFRSQWWTQLWQQQWRALQQQQQRPILQGPFQLCGAAALANYGASSTEHSALDLKDGQQRSSP